MRIAQINICDNGSTGKIMLDIFSVLDKDNERIAFVSHKYGNAPYVKRIHSKFGYRVHKFLSMYLGLDEWGSYFSTKKMIRALKKFSPDLLHLHNIHSHALNYRLLFRYIKKENLKTVWTLHDCWAFTGGCFYFERSGCERWKTGCGSCPDLKSAGMIVPLDCTRKLFRIKKMAFTGVKDMTLVTPSDWLKELAEQSFLKEYEIRVIRNGINTEIFSPTDAHTCEDTIDFSKKILLGVAAPFTERKGFSDFLKLAEILDDPYRLVLVGVSQEQKKLLPENVIGICRTENQNQLAELYSRAYAFVNLTYEDNFPTVNLEALACGAPVVCYRTGGAAEMLTEENGVVLEQGDYKGVLDALPKLEKIRENSGEFAREAKSMYSKEQMGRSYIDLYEQILGR